MSVATYMPPNWSVREGMPWYQGRARGEWTICEHCKRRFPKQRHNPGRFCGHACSAKATDDFRTPHICRSDLFGNWTPAEAWLAGLIWADGCLIELSDGKRVSVSSKDEEIVLHAAGITGCNVSASSQCDKPLYSVGFRSPEPIARLVALGLHPRKSLTLTYPEIPSESQRHFIRGYFDGDGSVMFKQSADDRARGNHPPCLNTVLAGSEAFLNGLQDHLCPATGVSRKRLVYQRIYRLTLGHADSMAFADYIYAEPGPCLTRKRDRYVSGRRPIAHWWDKGD